MNGPGLPNSTAPGSPTGARYSLRKGKVSKKDSKHIDVDLDEDGDVAAQLREALFESRARVLDVFRDWDDDETGTISKVEFHRAMSELKFEAPKSVIDAVFDEFDPDGMQILHVNPCSAPSHPPTSGTPCLLASA